MNKTDVIAGLLKSRNWIMVLGLIIFSGEAKTQFIKLDSILYQKFIDDSIYSFVLNNENARGRLPIFASNDLITLFRLRDTIINGIEINYFSDKDEMLKKYSLKKTGTLMEKIALKFVATASGKARISVTYAYFKCDKYMFSDVLLGTINNLYWIEYDQLGLVNIIPTPK